MFDFNIFSHNQALRIHISPQLKEELDKFGTFDVALRGPVEMKVNSIQNETRRCQILHFSVYLIKGKGVITTYWLMGENGRIIDKTKSQELF